MASLQIRELPEDVREALSLRARLENRSLAQQAVTELRRMPEVQAAEGRKALLAKIRGDLDQGTGIAAADPEALIREDRER